MYYSGNGAVYAASGQARQIIPQIASKEKHRWVIGTASLNGTANEINVLEFDEDVGNLECYGVVSIAIQTNTLILSFCINLETISSFFNCVV